MKLGENVIIVGLFVHILFFGFFMVVSVIFHKESFLILPPSPLHALSTGSGIFSSFTSPVL